MANKGMTEGAKRRIQSTQQRKHGTPPKGGFVARVQGTVDKKRSASKQK